MKKKKSANIHELSDRELSSELHDSEEKLFRMKYGHSTVTLKNPLQIRTFRKHVARLKTEVRLRECKAASSQSGDNSKRGMV